MTAMTAPLVRIGNPVCARPAESVLHDPGRDDRGRMTRMLRPATLSNAQEG